MARRTDQETTIAGAEAFRGAVVGAAKVEALSSLHPQLHHCSYILQLVPRPWLY